MTRLAVFAYSGTGHACLRLLLDRGERIVYLATHRDDPSEKRWFPSVAELARSRGIEPVVLENPLDPQAIVRLRIAAPDLLFSFYYRRVLPEEMLVVPRLGAYNMHGSLLPKFRGRAPVNWAVLKGETRTGATLHAMTPRTDAGAIVDQEAVPIGPEDTAFEVQQRVDAAAVAVLARRLEELKAGTAPARPQDEAAATRFGRRRPEDGRIDWSRPAREVHDLVRAVTHPYPGRLHGALRAEDVRLAHAAARPRGPRHVSRPGAGGGRAAPHRLRRRPLRGAARAADRGRRGDGRGRLSRGARA